MSKVDDILEPIKAILGYAQKKVDDTNETIDAIHGDLKKIDDIEKNQREMSSRIETKISGLDSRVLAIEDTVRKNLNADIKGVHNNIDRTYSRIDEIGNSVGAKLSGRFDVVDGNFGVVAQALNLIGDNVVELLRLQRDEIGELKKSAAELTGVKAKLETAQSQIRAKDGEISNLRSDFAAESEKLRQSDAALTEVKANLTEAENSIRAKDDEISRLTGELQTAQNNFTTLKQDADTEIANLSQQIEARNGEVCKVKEYLMTAQSERDTAQETLTAFRATLGIYAPVRDALTGCETFAGLREARGLTDNSEIGLFAYVQELGKTMDFLSAVHQAAKDFRAKQGNNPQLMTPAEVAVYDALNQCYRRIWGIEHDVFTTPGSRKSIAEPFVKTLFNKDEASALKAPTVKTFKFTQRIYVPMLLSQKGTMFKQGLVDAGNM